MKKKKIKTYKVSVYRGGSIFVKARTKGEAKMFANDEMIKHYGKVKAVDSITEVTPEDIENYPIIFRKLRVSKLNPGTNLRRSRMKNPRGSFTGAWTFVKGLIDSQGHLWPRHQGILDVTEVIEFGEIADEYGLSNKGYDDLIDKAQNYWNKKFLRNPGTKWHVDRKLFYYGLADKAKTKKERELYMARAGEQEVSAYTSRRLGMNPRRKRKNPSETKPMAKSLLPALIIGTVIVLAISYAGRRATEE